MRGPERKRFRPEDFVPKTDQIQRPRSTRTSAPRSTIPRSQCQPMTGPFSGCDGIDHQHCHRHGSNSTRNWRNVGRFLPDPLKINIPSQLSIRESINPHVDDHGTGPDHLWHDQFGVPSRYDQDIRKKRKLSKVSRLGVADANGGVTLHQHEGHGLPDNIARSHNHDVLAFRGDAFVLQQLYHSIGRARGKHGIAQYQPADVIEMKAVHVLVDRNCVENLHEVERRWERQLDQNPVNTWVLV